MIQIRVCTVIYRKQGPVLNIFKQYTCPTLLKRYFKIGWSVTLQISIWSIILQKIEVFLQKFKEDGISRPFFNYLKYKLQLDLLGIGLVRLNQEINCCIFFKILHNILQFLNFWRQIIWISTLSCQPWTLIFVSVALNFRPAFYYESGLFSHIYVTGLILKNRLSIRRFKWILIPVTALKADATETVNKFTKIDAKSISLDATRPGQARTRVQLHHPEFGFEDITEEEDFPELQSYVRILLFYQALFNFLLMFVCWLEFFENRQNRYGLNWIDTFFTEASPYAVTQSLSCHPNRSTDFDGFRTNSYAIFNICWPDRHTESHVTTLTWYTTYGNRNSTIMYGTMQCSTERAVNTVLFFTGGRRRNNLFWDEKLLPTLRQPFLVAFASAGTFAGDNLKLKRRAGSTVRHTASAVVNIFA